MDANSPVAIQAALGETEDLIAKMLTHWATAAGEEAKFAIWERTMYLATKAQLQQLGAFDGMTTETAKKDRIDEELRKRYPGDYEAHQANAQAKAKGDALFKGLDTRRSIGQTLLRAHMEDHKGQGYGAGQRNG